MTDAERFRAQGHAAIDLLADHLAAAAAGEGPVLPPGDPAALCALFPPDFPATAPPEDPVPGLLERVLAHANHLHHPRYVGHQVSAPLPVAALGELTAGLLNNGMAVFEMGPAGVAIERAVLAWLRGALALPEGADGFLTSGGSVGNLTALAIARQRASGRDVWEEGLCGGEPLCILTSEQTHYSVQRAARLLGLGAGGVIAVETDGAYRLRADALPGALARARASGRRPIAVVASAASTATGAYDPLEAVADFCAAEGLWLHVDGAHGGAAALSPKYRHLVRGIDRADSIVIDAHKMMLVPALCTAVLLRRKADSFAAFAQQATYLLSGEDGAWWDGAVRTLECTKRMLGLPLYLALHSHGTERFAAHVTATYDLARRFAAMIRERGDLELAVEPDANIVCFRLRPPGSEPGSALDEVQEAARARVVASGRAYLVKTRLRDGVYLRVTLINPATGERELLDLLDLLAALRQS